MGNYVSCTLSGPAGRESRAAKVVLPSGEIRQLHAATKAAELMLETPNFFLVNSRSLRMGQRFSALNADEDLEPGNVYVMFPMKRLNSVITTGDMGALFLVANSATKKSAASLVSMVQVLPAYAEPPQMMIAAAEEWRESGAAASSPKLNLDEIEGFSTTEYMHRLSMSRSKKPLLQTIEENC